MKPNTTSDWELKLEEILDEHFPKLNTEDVKIPSSNNRSAALVMYAETVRLVRDLISLQRQELLEEINKLEAYTHEVENTRLVRDDKQ